MYFYYICSMNGSSVNDLKWCRISGRNPTHLSLSVAVGAQGHSVAFLGGSVGSTLFSFCGLAVVGWGFGVGLGLGLGGESSSSGTEALLGDTIKSTQIVTKRNVRLIPLRENIFVICLIQIEYFCCCSSSYFDTDSIALDVSNLCITFIRIRRMYELYTRCPMKRWYTDYSRSQLIMLFVTLNIHWLNAKIESRNDCDVVGNCRCLK